MNNTDATSHDHAIDELWNCLANTPDLIGSSPELDALWVAVWRTVTTSGEVWCRPMGSRSNVSVRVTEDHADAELIAAWEWLLRNEERARTLGPIELFVLLRGVALRSGRGSARAFNSDRMCGFTNVPTGRWIAINGSDVLELIS